MTRQRFTAYHGVAKNVAADSARDLIKSGFLGPRQAPDGIHLGNMEQARMRAGGGVVFAVEIMADAASFRRVRDQVGAWRATVARAARSGVPGLVYLNRYEGIPTTAIERLYRAGDAQAAICGDRSSDEGCVAGLSPARALSGAELDGLSDRDFLRLVPEARDSWVILDPSLVRILGPV